MEIPLTHKWIRGLLSDEALEKAHTSAKFLITYGPVMHSGTQLKLFAKGCVGRVFPDLTPQQEKAVNFYVIGLAAAAGFIAGILPSVNSAPGLQFHNLSTKLEPETPAFDALMMWLETDVELTEDELRAIT